MDKGKKREEVPNFNAHIELAQLKHENARLKDNIKMLQGERPGLLNFIANGQKANYELNEYIRLLRINMANLTDEKNQLAQALQMEKIRYNNLAAYVTQRQQMLQNDMRAADNQLIMQDMDSQSNPAKRPRNTKSPQP